jgi:hypothetical protein
LQVWHTLKQLLFYQIKPCFICHFDKIYGPRSCFSKQFLFHLQAKVWVLLTTAPVTEI